MKILRGQSIVEVVIATALISMAVLAAMSLTTNSLKQTSYSKNLSEATKYGSQAADWLRTERTNLGWSTMNTLPAATYCLNTFPASYTALQSGACASSSYISNTLYQRTLIITKSGETIRATITVDWQEKIARQAKFEVELSRW